MKNERSRKSRMSKRHVEYLLRDVVDYDFSTLNAANRVLNDVDREYSDARVKFVRERVAREMRNAR